MLLITHIDLCHGGVRHVVVHAQEPQSLHVSGRGTTSRSRLKRHSTHKTSQCNMVIKVKPVVRRPLQVVRCAARKVAAVRKAMHTKARRKAHRHTVKSIHATTDAVNKSN